MEGTRQRRAHAPGWLSVLVLLGGVSVPATVAAAGDSHPGGVSEVCHEILHGQPTGDLEKVTEPADGSRVRPGDEITVKLKWDRDDFSGDSLHKVVDCVTVDGKFSAEASTMEKPTENDGEFRTTYRVPEDADEGVKVCDRGFASGGGAGNDGFERHKSNDVCFVVEKEKEKKEGDHEGDHEGGHEGDHEGGHGQGGPSDSDGDHHEERRETSPPAGNQSVTPPPTGEQVPTPPVESAVTPRPAGQPAQPVRRPESATLPRTGPSVRALVVLAGMAFVLGGAAVMGSVRRRPAGT